MGLDLYLSCKTVFFSSPKVEKSVLRCFLKYTIQLSSSRVIIKTYFLQNIYFLTKFSRVYPRLLVSDGSTANVSPYALWKNICALYLI